MKTKLLIGAIGMSLSLISGTALADDLKGCKDYLSDFMNGSYSPFQPKVSNKIHNNMQNKTMWVQAKNNHHTPAGESLAPGASYENQSDRHEAFEFTVVFQDNHNRRRLCTYEVSTTKYKAYGEVTKEMVFDQFICEGDELPGVSISCDVKFTQSKGKIDATFVLTDK